jgi:hypothetical protein
MERTRVMKKENGTSSAGADWITDELIEAVESHAKEKRIACAEAWRFADERGIPRKRIKALLDAAGIKVIQCQLGCF